MTHDRTIIANQAMALHQQGHIRDALALYEQALDGDPAPSASLLHLAGMAYLAEGKPRKAEALLGRAANNAHRADYHLGHGNALYELKWNARAKGAFQKAATLDPHNAVIWFNLGNAAEATRDYEGAAIAFNKTLEYDPLLTQALPNLITVLIKLQRFDDIAALMRQMHRLTMWKGFFYEASLMAIPAAAEAGDSGDIIEATLRSLREDKPDDDQVLCLLGNFLLMRREFAEAEQVYLRAIDVEDHVGAKRAAAILLALHGKSKQARTFIAETIESDPEGDQLLKLAILVVQLSNKNPASIAVFDLLHEACPDNQEIFKTHVGYLSSTGDWKNLIRVLKKRIETEEKAEYLGDIGAAHINLRQETAALKYLYRAIELDPKHYSAWFNLSSILVSQGRDKEAYQAGQKALRLNPKIVAATSSLALLASKMNQVDECERILKRGLRHNPDSSELLNLLGNTYLRRGDMKRALDYFARARRNAANDGAQFAMQLMAVNYSAEIAPEIVSEMHFKWGDSMVANVKKPCDTPPPAQLKKRLKVGFVSGDYKAHSCSYFMAPLLANLNPDRVDVYCYMTEGHSDEVTLKFRRTARHWREIATITDTDAAKMIQEDGIDILVELSGHTSGGRLGLMAMKPAPIQVTWLGYPNTTGLPTIDYRFTDALADPPGMTDRYFREKLYRLPHFLCYEPPEFTPPVAPLPAKSTGMITFGCFNNSNKITDEVVAVWAKIMARVPNSRMFLKTSNLSDQLTLSAFRRKFERGGIAPDRIECFQGFRNKSDHLMTYSDIDLALDPFPYNGTTTTFEALWMGVPMVTLEGSVHAGRVGHCIMTAVGLGELSAASIDDYIALAVDVSLDPDRIAAWRAGLRQKLQQSPLMDAPAFARSMEDAFFDMWHHAVSETKSRRKAG